MIRHLSELIRFRGLIGALVVRHLAARYRGSLLGFLWSILTPLCLMAVYTLVFQFYMRGVEREHYAIFLFTGLLPWTWFASGLQEGTAAVVGSGHLITKSMFPPQVLPFVSVVTTLVNFLLSLPVLAIFMLASGVPIPWTATLLPVVILLQALFLYGCVLGLSALNVYFRDVQHLLANALTLLFFLCPVIYVADMVPERFRFTIEWNPAAILIQLYHQVLLDGVLPGASQTGIFFVFLIAVVGLGYLIFERCREGFAELL